MAKFQVRSFGDHTEWKSISPSTASKRIGELIDEGWHEIKVGGNWHDLLDEGACGHAAKLIEVGAKSGGPR